MTIMDTAMIADITVDIIITDDTGIINDSCI